MALLAAPSYATADLFCKSRTPRQTCSKQGYAERHASYRKSMLIQKT